MHTPRIFNLAALCPVATRTGNVRAAGALALLLLLGGCAFDVVQVKQLPVTFSTAMAPRGFTLQTAAEVRIGTGFPVRLKANTRWTGLGTTEFGEVYTTRDQVLTVEASNIHEAALVLRDGEVAGFYLLIEKKFCPATKPIRLAITQA